MSRPKRKSHIVRNGVTACGRNASGLLASVVLHPSIPFVLLKQLKRDEIIERTTCVRCIKGRYNA